MKKLGVGVVGVGEMGKRHAENIAQLVPNARLVAVADPAVERAKSVAAELEVEHYFDSIERLVELKEVQAVVIVSPPIFHPHAIRVAAAAGKDILCEKPLALTMEEADAALEAVKKAGVIFHPGFMRRYDPAYAQAKARIEAGEIGEPVIFKSIGRDQFAPPPGYFETGWVGTLFHDSTVHDFDLARWLMNDEVAEVQAFSGTRALPFLAKLGLYDATVANLRYVHGAIGNLESFADARYGYDVRSEVVGTKGTLQIGTLHDAPLQVLTEPGRRHTVVNHFFARFADAYVLEMRDFVNCVLSGTAPRLSGEDGRRALALVLAAAKSCAESRPVKLPTPAASAA